MLESLANTEAPRHNLAVEPSIDCGGLIDLLRAGFTTRVVVADDSAPRKGEGAWHGIIFSA